MSDSNLIHNTFLLERTFPKSVRSVFAAFSVLEKKRRWYASSSAHDVLSYELDFSKGGKEVLVGRMKAGTPISGTILRWSQTFEDIVEDQRIVFTQTLDWNGRRISCSLITIELRPQRVGCSLVLTHQGVYFEGADGPQMREMGWRGLLDAMSAALE